MPWFGRGACGLGTDAAAYRWYGVAGGGRGDGQLRAATDLTGVVGKVAGQR